MHKVLCHLRVYDFICGMTVQLTILISSVPVLLSVSSLQAVTPPKHNQFQWLHIPKTGSTFSLTIQVACNETQFWKVAPKSFYRRHVRMWRGCAVFKNINMSFTNCHQNCYNGLWHKSLTKRMLAPQFELVAMLRKPQNRVIYI